MNQSKPIALENHAWLNHLATLAFEVELAAVPFGQATAINLTVRHPKPSVYFLS
jgi:hypothetical protein